MAKPIPTKLRTDEAERVLRRVKRLAQQQQRRRTRGEGRNHKYAG